MEEYAACTQRTHYFNTNVEGCQVFTFYKDDKITKQLITERPALCVTSALRPCRNVPGAPQTWSGGLLTHTERERVQRETRRRREQKGCLSSRSEVHSPQRLKSCWTRPWKSYCEWLPSSSGATHHNSGEQEWRGMRTHARTRLIQCCNNYKGILCLILLYPNLSILLALSWNLIWSKSKY